MHKYTAFIWYGNIDAKFKKSDYNNMNIDKSFTAFNKDDVKVIYKLKLDGEKTYK